jgi:hypothetical protein
MGICPSNKYQKNNDEQDPPSVGSNSGVAGENFVAWMVKID